MVFHFETADEADSRSRDMFLKCNANWFRNQCPMGEQRPEAQRQRLAPRAMLKVMIAIACLVLATGSARGSSSSCDSIPAAAPITWIGTYSDMRYTEEHAYGYEVSLWRSGKCLFGLMSRAEGLIGDTPTGRLEGVRFDSRSGALTFFAKLTTGIVWTPGSDSAQAARDRFEFKGRLTGSQLSGTFVHSLLNKSSSPPETSQVRLRVQPNDSESMLDLATYADWRAVWEPVLKRLGPKW